MKTSPILTSDLIVVEAKHLHRLHRLTKLGTIVNARQVNVAVREVLVCVKSLHQEQF